MAVNALVKAVEILSFANGLVSGVLRVVLHRDHINQLVDLGADSDEEELIVVQDAPVLPERRHRETTITNDVDIEVRMTWF